MTLTGLVVQKGLYDFWDIKEDGIVKSIHTGPATTQLTVSTLEGGGDRGKIEGGREGGDGGREGGREERGEGWREGGGGGIERLRKRTKRRQREGEEKEEREEESREEGMGEGKELRKEKDIYTHITTVDP